MNDYLTVLQLFGGNMPHYWVDDPDDDFDYDTLDLDTQEEPVSMEEQIRWFVEKFGYEPKIKDPSAFSLSAMFDFEFGLENAIEVQDEHS